MCTPTSTIAHEQEDVAALDNTNVNGAQDQAEPNEQDDEVKSDTTVSLCSSKVATVIPVTKY